MLLEDKWTERVYVLFPEQTQKRVRKIGDEIYQTVRLRHRRILISVTPAPPRRSCC
jgi:hypothetical protein